MTLAPEFDASLRWLFCPTHPDDELACAGTIRRLTRAGAEVWMCWTHSNPVREAEARHAASLLGVLPHRLIFLGATDGAVCDEMPMLLPRFQEVIRQVSPDRVVCGAFEQGHLDHDATHVLARRCFAGPVLEFPLYHTYRQRVQRVNRFPQADGVIKVPLTKEERRFKMRLARCYPSQNVYALIVLYAALHQTRRPGHPIGASERFRVASHQDFRRPNHPVAVARRIQASPKWHRWLQALDAFEEATP